MRWLLWRVVWGFAFRTWAGGLRVTGTVPRMPVVFAANHQSHADTAAVQLAVARSGCRRMLTAGAEDYFFRTKPMGVIARLIGVFPFPRHGRAGIERAAAVLESGWSVLLFPEGSRRGGPFRPGVAHLAERGWTVVPVTIRGTGRLLPRGACWPTRAAVEIHFGPPLRRLTAESPRGFAARLERAVRDGANRTAA